MISEIRFTSFEWDIRWGVVFTQMGLINLLARANLNYFEVRSNTGIATFPMRISALQKTETSKNDVTKMTHALILLNCRVCFATLLKLPTRKVEDFSTFKT